MDEGLYRHKGGFSHRLAYAQTPPERLEGRSVYLFWQFLTISCCVHSCWFSSCANIYISCKFSAAGVYDLCFTWVDTLSQRHLHSRCKGLSRADSKSAPQHQDLWFGIWLLYTYRQKSHLSYIYSLTAAGKSNNHLPVLPISPKTVYLLSNTDSVKYRGRRRRRVWVRKFIKLLSIWLAKSHTGNTNLIYPSMLLT